MSVIFDPLDLSSYLLPVATVPVRDTYLRRAFFQLFPLTYPLSTTTNENNLRFSYTYTLSFIIAEPLITAYPVQYT